MLHSWIALKVMESRQTDSYCMNGRPTHRSPCQGISNRDYQLQTTRTTEDTWTYAESQTFVCALRLYSEYEQVMCFETPICLDLITLENAIELFQITAVSSCLIIGFHFFHDYALCFVFQYFKSASSCYSEMQYRS